MMRGTRLSVVGLAVFSLACGAEPAAFPLPNSADAACHADGNSLRFELRAAPPDGVLRFPRLNNVVLEAFWAPLPQADDAVPAGKPLPGQGYPPPPLTPPDRLLALRQTPETWSLAMSDQVTYPAAITLRLASPPLHAPEGYVCTAAEDQAITLPARHAIVSGEKLQFEPLPHKNTVGYWVNSGDHVEWLFATAAAGSWDVHVLQGCGSGQGGSRVAFSVGDASLEYVVADTGHFQNFRWHRVGTLDLPQADRHTLRVSCLEKAGNAVMDIREIRLVPHDH